MYHPLLIVKRSDADIFSLSFLSTEIIRVLTYSFHTLKMVVLSVPAP